MTRPRKLAGGFFVGIKERMCSGMSYKGKWADSQKRLGQLIGKENIVFHPGYASQRPEFCLCPVDFNATAKNIGCVADMQKYCYSDGEFTSPDVLEEELIELELKHEPTEDDGWRIKYLKELLNQGK